MNIVLYTPLIRMEFFFFWEIWWWKFS